MFLGQLWRLEDLAPVDGVCCVGYCELEKRKHIIIEYSYV